MLGFQPRAFSQNVDRINRRTTIVYSADDIRRAVTICVNEQRPCVLELGDNIAVGGSYGGGFTLPIGLKSFRIDGADTFRFVVTDDLPFLFKALGSASAGAGFPVEVTNTKVVVLTGADLATVFVVDQTASSPADAASGVAVSNVAVDGAGGSIASVFALADRLGASGRIVVDGLQALSVTNLFAIQPSTSSWAFSSVRNVFLVGVSGGNVGIGTGAAGVSFVSCIFEQISGAVNIDTGEFSFRNLWSVISGNLIGSFTTNNPGGGLPQTLVRVDGFGSKSLSPDDKDLDL